MKKRNKDSKRDPSDKLRYIVPEKIGKNTIMMKIYKETLDLVIKHAGVDKWINRTVIVRKLVDNGLGTTPAVQGHLALMYQTKYSMESIEDTTGLFMRKKNDVVQLKFA